MGKLNKKESLRLLEIAYDNGIRHFDTAPSYGYGESEALLGTFLRRHSDVTVATKVGLFWPKTGRAYLITRAKQIVRPFLRAFPLLQTQARKAAHAGARPLSTFDVNTATSSLETSLRRLRRDSIDIFLLHECRASDLTDDRLLGFLSSAKERGRVRAFGIGTDIATIAYCVESAQQYASILQFANNTNEPNLELMPSLASARACITHSPFGGVGKVSQDSLKSALAYATVRNPTGIVLFSSQSMRHIVDNIRTFA